MKVRLPRILLGMLVGASWPSPEPPFKGYCAIRWRIRLRSVYPRVALGAIPDFGMEYSFAGGYTLPLVAF